MRIQSFLALTAAAVLLVSGAARTASALTIDHLKCYKVKDVGAFKSATADFAPSQVGFPTENCKLKGKAAQLCIPADKDNVVITGGTLNNFPAQALVDAQLCYKVKCPKTALPDIQVSDQFGTRNIGGFKPSKICGPALEQ
jgi:hypothetical protein